jgi:hypothetical protein
VRIISVKAGGKQSNLLARYFGLYKTQEGNKRVDLSSHWLAGGANETAVLSHDHRANQLGIRQGDGVTVCWARNRPVK